MQKKMLAVAVAGALGAPALAFGQGAPAGTSTVQIFGTLYGELDWYNNKENATSPVSGAPRESFDYFRTSGSEIGLKGEESLGGGMAAWFQCTSTADFRGSGINNNAVTGWCSRNSGLGLKGPWGNTWIGIWDTPMKRTYAIGNVGSGETGGFGNSPVLMNGATVPGQGTQPNPAGRGVWSRREANSFFYDSPNIAGFQVTANFQFANGSTNVTRGTTNSKPRVWGLAGSYSAGPFAAGVFYEKHNDQGTFSGFGGAPAATFPVGFAQEMDDKSYGVAASFTFGPVKFGGVWKREDYDVPRPLAAPAVATSGGVGRQHVSAWHLGFDWNIVGPHGLRGGYSRAGDVKGSCMSSAPDCAGPGAVAATGVAPLASGYRPGMGVRPDAQGSTAAAFWQIKYVFAFSKRTELNFGYARIQNRANAGYQFSDIAGNVAPGKDPSAWVFSMKHTF